MWIGQGKLELNDIKHLLKPIDLRERIRLQPAPANGLILSDMHYKNIKFTDCEYSKNKLIEELQKQYIFHNQEKMTDLKMMEILGKL
jgi:tRNA pseudouridine38-40 synthase